MNEIEAYCDKMAKKNVRDYGRPTDEADFSKSYMSKAPRWSEEEIEALKIAWKANKPVQVIADEIGRPKQACFDKAHRLGLPAKKYPNKIQLSENDMLWLKLNYPHMRTVICAIKLGISLRFCVRLARKLGVEKTEQFMRESQAFTARKAKESHLAHNTYPPKGVINENLAKGEAYRFKPGHKQIRKKIKD